MPLNTAVPSDRRISAPAPVAMTSGTTPRRKANEVISKHMGKRMTASSFHDRVSHPVWTAHSRTLHADSDLLAVTGLKAHESSPVAGLCTKIAEETSRKGAKTQRKRGENQQG
jgi:hypothetical protein